MLEVLLEELLEELLELLLEETLELELLELLELEVGEGAIAGGVAGGKVRAGDGWSSWS